MSKFAKRIKKLNKKARNVLVVGDAWGNLPEMVENFNSIFLIDDHKRIFRSKNVIYRENFDNISHIYDVDIILLNLDHENRLPEILPVIKRCNPIIVIEGPEIISKENQKFLKSHHYEIVEIHKTYFQWKLRRS